MLIKVVAHCSQDVSVSILLRARAMLIEVVTGPLFAGCECVDPPSSSSHADQSPCRLFAGSECVILLQPRAMLIEVLPTVRSM